MFFVPQKSLIYTLYILVQLSTNRLMNQTAFFAALLFLCSFANDGNCISFQVFVSYSDQNDYQSLQFNSSNCSFSILNSSCCEYENGTRMVCESLEDALNIIEDPENACFNNFINIFLAQESIHNLTKLHYFNRQSIKIQGLGNVQINCMDGALMIFNFSRDVSMVSTSFHQCGNHTQAALTFINVQNVSLEHILLDQSIGAGMNVVVSEHLNTSYTIFDCMFTHTGGSAVIIRINSSFSFSTFDFNSCLFTQNMADDVGGAINTHVHVANSSNINNYILMSIIMSNFTENRAVHYGGGIFLQQEGGMLEMFYNSCYFTNNSAGKGGAIYHASIDLVSQTMCAYAKTSVHHINTHWEGNKAMQAATIFYNSLSYFTLVIESSMFIENTVLNRTFSLEEIDCVSDVVNCGQVRIDNTDYVNNWGTALCVFGAKAEIAGCTTFSRNTGFLGGALFFKEASLTLENGSYIVFDTNVAAYGGAVYLSVANNDDYCAFTMSNIFQGRVEFTNNTAYVTGQDVYFSQPSNECANRVVHSFRNNSTTSVKISSTALNVSLDFDSFYIFLGQCITLNTTVRDFKNNPTTVNINIYLFDEQNYQISTYHLHGFTSFSISDGLNYPNLTIIGPEILPRNRNNNSYMMTISPMNIPILTVSVKLIPCPLGYHYDPVTYKCHCSSSFVLCNMYLNTSGCIQQGYWHGPQGDDIITVPCSSGYCTTLGSGCKPCVFPVGQINSYCQLPDQDTNEQCVENRGGVLCTNCIQDHAFTFGAVQCVKDTDCGGKDTVWVAFLALAFIILLVVLLIVLLKVDYKIRSGYLFAFVYYFSIIGYIIPPSMVSKQLLLIVSIMQSFSQLNPRFLGYIPLCLGSKFSIVHHTVILYLNPIIIIIIVFLIIGVSKLFSKHIKFNDSAFLRAICLLILLCFTSLTDTSFNILNPVRFIGIQTVYLYIQPSTEYFDLIEHLPWFLVALLVEILLVLPFTFLLLFSPYIGKYINLIKIKPFLDEFQGTYKDNMRWMAGYYFLCRLIFLVIIVSPTTLTGVETLRYIIQFYSFTVAFVHMLLQPYSSKWLNIADSIILIDFAFVTLLYGVSSSSIFTSSENNKSREIIAFILVLIPILIAVIFICSQSSIQARIMKLFRTALKFLQRKQFSYSRYSPTLLQPLAEEENRVSYRDSVLELLDSGNIDTTSRSTSSSSRGISKCSTEIFVD